MIPYDPNQQNDTQPLGSSPNANQSSAPTPGYIGMGAPVPVRRFHLGAVLAVILVTGVVIVGVLLAAAYVLRAEPSSKPPVVNVSVAAPTAASTATPRDTSTPVDIATPRDTATAPPTITPKPTSTPRDTATTRPADIPQDTATPAPNDGVSVCTDADYDHPNVVCNQTDSSLGPGDYTAARLVVTGPQGGAFQHNSLLYLLSQANTEGSYTQLGTATDTVPVADTSQSMGLSWLFDATSTTPSFDGSTYLIEVDSGDVSLGTFTVTLTANDRAAPADTPTDVPASSSADYTATDACQGATSATDIVIRYYRAIGLRQYAAAYQCFDTGIQAGKSLDAWMPGYANTVSTKLVLAHLQPDGKVWIDLHTVDRTNTGLVAGSFAGTWTLDAHLKLQSANVVQINRKQVDAVPTPDVNALFAFDDATILSDVMVNVTGSSTPDEVIVSRTNDCGACSTRRVLIYADNMLVFSTKFLDGVNSVEPIDNGTGFTVVTPKANYTYNWTPAGFDELN